MCVRALKTPIPINTHLCCVSAYIHIDMYLHISVGREQSQCSNNAYFSY